MDTLHVYADVDEGRGCVDAWTHCVCMRMRMSIKKGQQKKHLLGDMGDGCMDTLVCRCR